MAKDEKKAMTKSQIVAHFAEKFEMTKAQAKGILEEYTELATKECKKKGEFLLPGIGKLVLQQRKARKGRNPMTGEEIKIPAKKVVKVRLSKSIKDAIVPPK